jgi:hypothetical protein
MNLTFCRKKSNTRNIPIVKSINLPDYQTAVDEQYYSNIVSYGKQEIK